MFTRSLPLLLLVLLLLTGCNSAPTSRSTRMTVDDLNEMSEAMAQSLARSDALRDRTPTSEPWVISIDRAQNLSSDVMTESEKWFVVQKLRSTLPIQAMSKQKNITFVIPKERLDAIRANPKLDVGSDPNFGATRKPTHQMNATFRSLTRANKEGTGRTEAYYCEFEIMEFASAVPVWADKFEYKRGATGHIWD
jgi:hypothetical protein